MRFDLDVEKISQMIQTKTLKQTALHLCVPYYVLYNFCKKNNLKSSVTKRGRENKTEKYIDDVVKYYLEGMSQAEIAKKIGVCQKTVHDLIKKSAFHLRTRSEAAKQREAQKSLTDRQKQAAAANAVRHAMSIVNFFG